MSPIAANAFAQPFLLIHIVGGIVALAIGPFQFIAPVRRRWPNLHRATGLTYVAACTVAAPAGLALALGTTAGPIAVSGFAALAILWFYFTAQGLCEALSRRFADHREWMLRSYALTAAAITLRLMIPAAMISGFDFAVAYPIIAWACWTLNLAVAEYVIRRNRPTTPVAGALVIA